MDSYDVLVLGTGAAGLCAALAAADSGATVGLLEKGAKVGGTTALSGGVAWIPANQYAAAAGLQDSPEEALAYLDSLSHGLILPELAEALVETGPEMLQWLEERTPLRLRLVPGFPDYHPEHPGGMARGGRSLEPELFSFAGLGDWGGRVVGPSAPLRLAETPLGGGTGLIDADVATGRRSEQVEGLGRAMVGALLQGCLGHGVTPRLEHRAVSLLMDDGRVSGALVESPIGVVEVRARAVVIATGGFESDVDLVRDFLRGPVSHPPGVPTNTGDGLKMAMRVGARLGNMREAWWVPVATPPPTGPGRRRHPILVLRERALPRSIIVNRFGRRFTNEAANYNALGGAFHQFDPASFTYLNQPCHLVFDQGFVDQYGGFGAPPGGPVPAWVTRGQDLDELATKIGVPAGELGRTVRRFNELVATGHDDDFQRGDSAYDGWCGDRQHYPTNRSTLGPLDSGPYYAVELFSSTLGTKGGPRTDVDGAVLDVDGEVIPGLYAAGNAMAGPTGMVYGGAGGTLGPALVFGYRAAGDPHKAATRA